ncbi:MAG: hypothetical protein Q8Q23_03770 [bacterium]|nr:hypothetical protein [bacterium]
MSKEEPTNLEILEAVQNLNKRVDSIEDTNTEILQAVNNFATATEERWQENDKRWQENDGRLTRVEATMVTKDYLDDKLADLKGDIITVIRKEDTKLKTLVNILEKRKTLTADEVKQILSM